MQPSLKRGRKMDYKRLHKDIVNWAKNWFDENGKDSSAVIGISGGKDSTVCAAILKEALGPTRVIGVMMPNGMQKDISDSEKVCKLLSINYCTVNIGNAYQALSDTLDETLLTSTKDNPMYSTNTPARLRMTALYGIASVVNGRVCNTCNLSEDYIGYSTKFGDAAGDFSLLSKMTVTEVRGLGDELGLPHELVHKVPSDGMCGKTDEDNLGFTYEELDKWIREGVPLQDNAMQEKVLRMHDNPNTQAKLHVPVSNTFFPEYLV